MDGSGFDALTRTLSNLRTRRGAAQVLLGVALGTPPLPALDEAAAKRGAARKRRKRRAQRRERDQHGRDDAQADKKKGKKPCPPCKKRKKGKCKGKLPDGAACPGGSCRAGSCVPATTPQPDCTPACGGRVCGGDDGCGQSCGTCTGGLTCQDGQCVLTCGNGLTDCAGNCVDLQTDVDHCGDCGTACAFPHASARCQSGACELGACDAGFANCDGDLETGCETNTRTDPAHCGACGHACSAPANATATCANSTCSFTCATGFHRCGDACVRNDDVAHCGDRCDPCPTSACSPATCDGVICGHAPIDGCCEQDSDCGDSDACTTDWCGDHTCQHTAITCTSSDLCRDPVCDPLHGCQTVDHCAANEVCNPVAGVPFCCPETRPLWDGSQCAECTPGDLTRCPAPPPNSAVACTTQGTCSSVCLPGWGACALNAVGCETNLQTDAAHCGGCWQACASGQACLDGVCGVVCGSGFCAVTDDNPDCCGTHCTNTQTDAANCGACGQACPDGDQCGSATCCSGLRSTDDLQAAISAAAPGATLRLCAGTWALAQTIVIDKDLTLLGAGPGQTILDGGDAVSVLRVIAPMSPTHVTVRGLTITRGRTAGNGGGIFNGGFLLLRNVDVTHNVATNATKPLSSIGGGIWNFGSLTVVHSRVLENRADRSGGGIANTGNTVQLQLTLGAGSLVSGNTAIFGGGVSSGGMLTLQAGSSVSGNTAQPQEPNSAYRGYGGGISNAGMLVLKTGSSVSENAAGEGGGIYGVGATPPTLQATDIVTNNHLLDGITVSNCAPVGAIPNCLG